VKNILRICAFFVKNILRNEKKIVLLQRILKIRHYDFSEKTLSKDAPMEAGTQWIYGSID